MGIDVARKLRQEGTLPEVILWQRLRGRRFKGLKFRRQYPVGPYVVDFICLEQKIVVELDGGQHADQQHYDNKRTAYLEAFGLSVVRFWNHDVLNRLELVMEQLSVCVES